MKEKTSITLSRDLLAAVDRLSGDEPRSAFIERVLRLHVRSLKRAERDAADLERLNRAADELNAEAAEVLEHQAPWPDG